MSFVPEHETLADPKALLNVPVGLASPLWPLFAGAAMGGAAWWWMTRWTQPANLEAMFGAAAKAEVETVEAAAEPVIETAEAVTEPVIEAAPESVAEALIEAPVALEPVGGEAAPVSPVLAAIPPETVEADTAPKPKKKPAAAPTPEAD